jgi:hypothetical protein
MSGFGAIGSMKACQGAYGLPQLAGGKYPAIYFDYILGIRVIKALASSGF